MIWNRVQGNWGLKEDRPPAEGFAVYFGDTKGVSAVGSETERGARLSR